MTVTIKSLIYSGDDIKVNVAAHNITITDTRIPVVTTSDITYTIYSDKAYSIIIGAKLYGKTIDSIEAAYISRVSRRQYQRAAFSYSR